MALVRLLRPPSHRHFLRFFCSTNTSTPTPSPSPNANANQDPPPLFTSRAVNSAIHSLYQERNLDRFLSVLQHYTTSYPLFRSRISIYEVAVLRFAEAGRLDNVTAILDSLKSYLSSDPKTPSFLISLYGKAGMVDSAWETFRQLPQTVRSFNALLLALGGESGVILEALKSVPLEFPEVVPDVFSHSIAVNALCREGKLDHALDHLKVMEETGVAPNVVTFNTLLHAFYTKNHYDEAEKIWQLMEESKCSPNPRSYNTKLRWLVNNGRTDDAANLFNEMERKGLKPDGHSLTVMIVGYCKDDKLKEAKKLYGQFSRLKCPRNPWLYEALLPKLCEAGELHMAFCLCNESLKNCIISVDVLQKVVDCLVGASRFRDGKKLVEDAWSKQHYKDVLKMPLACITWEKEQQHQEKTAEMMESETEMVVNEEKEKLTEVSAEATEPKTEMVVNEGEQKPAAETTEEMKPNTKMAVCEGKQKLIEEEGAYAKIGIIVKSFEKPNYLGAFGIPLNKNRVKLPSTRSLITVLRSPHVDKKSREQFEMKVRREYIVIKCKPQELHKKYFWFKRSRILGAQFELVFSYKTRLDMSRLQRPS